MEARKVRRKPVVSSDDDQRERIREMLELYTMVPPSPYVIRKEKLKTEISEK